MDCTRSTLSTFESLSIEARELYLGTRIRSVDISDVTPLNFYRSYVSTNIPVKILNSFNHWSALTSWNDSYLCQQLGDEEVTVAITPDGYADAITNGKFMLPYERKMRLTKFFEMLNNPSESPSEDSPVCYIQKQNSNMTSEFKRLLCDIDTELPWASEAFGCKPDAVNFWMGDKRAITSTHKDHYENIYCVVRGEKKFTLIPPTDQPFIPYIDVAVGQYEMNDEGAFQVLPGEGTLPWVAIDPTNPDIKSYPLFKKANIYEVTVREGEALYLPSLWYHHVQQSHGCIAVNYWYDMQFDIKYNYYQFVSRLVTGLLK